MLLPINYKEATTAKRKQAREQYVLLQGGLCHHCGSPLMEVPPKSVTDMPINWKLFPPNFLKYPVHLHHSHDTEMTIGAVHAYCNAVLWEYYNE